jgi:signal transduction histidine kinase
MSASTYTEPAAERPEESKGNALRRLWRAKPWMAAGFLVTSFVFGTALFVILVTLIALGAGLAITLIGIPILGIALLTWMAAAMLERQRIKLFFGETIREPYKPRPEGTLLHRARALLGDGAVWKDLIYGFLLFPIGVAELVIVTVALTLPFSMIAAPTYYWAGDGPTIFGDNAGTGWQVDTLPEALLFAAVGLVLLLPCLWIIVGVARGHVLFAKWMLGRNREEELEERVDVLTKTRSDVMDAMLLERQRIERDLHDGAQQRLVSLAMTLGMAKEKMETDPEAAKALVSASHEEAKQVLGELRQLVRGIHPAVLTDRGLDAAISALAGRSPVPVTVEVHLDRRLPEAIESTAYFVVAEALTNVAKHSGASQARVTIWLEEGVLTVLVWDNGTGGARIRRESGLGGLADRVAALDGSFTVESGESGGTTVRAEIPCGS